MFDIGWSELLVIGVVALIVVGPKDLPIMFRRMGQFTGRARAMAREFTSAMSAAADESGMREMSKDLRNIANPKRMGLDAINNAADDLSNWDDAEGGPAARPRSEPAEGDRTAANTTREASAHAARETGRAAAKPAATATDDGSK